LIPRSSASDVQLVEAVEDITVQASVVPDIVVDCVVVCLVPRVIRSAGVKNQMRQFDVQAPPTHAVGE
jgi:hypothetical protein